MTSPPLDAWTAWSAAWQDTADRGVDVRAIAARARTRARLLRVVVIGEVLTSIGMLWLVGFVLAGRRDAIAVAWGASVLVALAVTWTFSILNRRHAWRAVGEQMIDYVRLSRAQARAALRTVRYARWLLASVWALQLLFVIADHRPFTRDALLVAAAVALYSAGILVWTRWYRRRALRELAETEALEDALSATTE